MGSTENPSSCPLMRRSLTVGKVSERSEEVRLRTDDGLVENVDIWRDEGREVVAVDEGLCDDDWDKEKAARSDD